MNKQNIFEIYQRGFGLCTANELNADNAYLLYKFKTFVSKTYNEIEEERKSLISSILGEKAQDDINEFQSLEKMDYVSLTDDEKKRFSELKDRIEKATAILNKMFAEEVKIEKPTPMPYEQWHLLQKENSSKTDVLNIFETQLENVLWVAPKATDF